MSHFAFREMTLRTRLMFLMASVVAAISLVILLILPARLEDQATRSAHDKARSIADMTAFSVAPALLFDDRAAAIEALAGLHSIEDVEYVVVTKGNRKFAEYRRHPGALHAEYEVTAPIESRGRLGSLRVGLSLASLKSAVQTSRRDAAVISLFVLLLGVAAVAAITTLLTRPLGEIGAAARRIEQGDLTSRAQVRSGDEIGQLARTFNRMLDGIERAQADLAELNSDLEKKVAERTQELAAEADVRRRVEERMRLVLLSTQDGILTVDASGACTLINPAGSELLGLPASELIGHNPHEILHGGPCARPGCALDLVVAGDQRNVVAASFTRRDGVVADLEFSSARIVEPGVGTHGAVLTFRDITERETLRRSLEEAQRIASLGHLAAMMAHEFNNVLMGIQALIEVIQRQSDASPRTRHACELITRSVHRGKRVTEEVLRYTRPRDPVHTSIDVREWTQHFVASMGPSLGPDIDVQLVLPEGEVFLAADSEQIEQVFANLFTNARDAITAPGRITMRVRQTDDRQLVVFEVSDSGSGIPAEVLPRIFEPFVTTKHSGGTGLGLAIAKQIIGRHGGAISVRSSSAGTTFSISLRAADVAPVLVEERRTVKVDPMRVLLVEDDEVVATGLRAALEVAGHAVACVDRGAAVMAAVESFEPDAIVLDVGLPDMDGADVYRQVAVRYPALPVVFSTGHADAGRLREAFPVKHVDFLLKPYATSELLAKLGEVSAPTREDG